MDEDSNPRRTVREQRQENVLKEREEALKRRDTSLKYGNPGGPFYNFEQEHWEFSRRMVPSPQLEPAGGFDVVIPSPIKSLPMHPPCYSRKISELPRVYHDVSLATDFLVEEGRISNHIISAAAYYEPTFLNRFTSSYANISYEAPVRAVPIVAFVTGKSGDQVKFLRTRMVDLAWSKPPESILRVPEIGEIESLWYGRGAPVQQIKAAQGAEENEAWLAVQLATSTTIFHPRNYRQPVPASAIRCGTTDPREPASQLHANPVATISMAQTGGFAHADVSFNPWFSQQLAIIDRQMNWSIWEMKYKHALHPHAIKKLSGTIDSDDDECLDDASLHAVDGWARVCWTAVDKLAVCRRRRLCVYHIGDYAVKIPTSGLDLLQESEWILDMSIIPGDPSKIFILTSVRVIWLRITSSETSNDGDEAGAQAEVLLSWRHFRSDDDVSLTLEVQNVEESVSVLIYSRLNPLASFYRFSSPSASCSIPVSLSDPSLLTLLMEKQSGHLGVHLEARVSTVSFQKLEYDSLSDDIGAKYESMGIEFYKFTVLASDLSVRECLYTARDLSRLGDRSLLHDEDIRLPSIKKYRKYENPHTQVKSEQKVIDDLITRENELDIFLPRDPFARPAALLATRRKSSLREIRNGWTVDYELFYEMMTETRGKRSQFRSLDSYVEDLQRLLESHESSWPTLCTVLELLKSTPRMNDVESASRKMEILTNTITDSTHTAQPKKLVAVGLTSIWLSSINWANRNSDGVAKPNFQTLNSIYSYLVQRYLDSIPKGFSDQGRSAKTEVLGQISMDLFRAGMALRPVFARPSPANLPSTALELPVRDKGKGKVAERMDPPGPPSLPPLLSSQSTMFYEAQDPQFPDEDPACSRLRAYTTVKTLPPLTQSMANVLAHWSEGQDPQLYNWERTEALLAEPSAAEYAEQERQAKTKLRRRKQQLLDEPGRLAHVSDEQAPTRRAIESQSQPLTILASSQMMGDVTSASQKEKAKKARKKKAGF